MVSGRHLRSLNRPHRALSAVDGLLQLQAIFNYVPRNTDLGNTAAIARPHGCHWASVRARIGGSAVLRDSLLTTLLTTPQHYHCWRLLPIDAPDGPPRCLIPGFDG